MPYITETRREEIMTGAAVNTAGELAWVLSAAINLFLKDRALYKDTNNFTDYADVMGALEATKSEFIRMVLSPYEEQKRFENGDVYD